jgi:CRISPR-associated endoribonuclease Cas6
MCDKITLNIDKQQSGGVVPLNYQYAALIVKLSLLNKYRAFYGHDFSEEHFPFSLRALTKPRSSLISIREGTPQESKIRGFMCRFELTAPVELMKIMYETGLGSKNNQRGGMSEKMIMNGTPNLE